MTARPVPLSAHPAGAGAAACACDLPARPAGAPRRGLLHPLSLLFGAMLLLTALAAAPARAAEADGEAAAGMLEAAMEKVFTVRSADPADRFLGSAFVWGEGGEVAVTNAHVVGDATEVRLVDRHGAALVAPVIARDAVRDVAVIGLGPGGRAGFAPGAAPRLGDPVWALGAPLGIEFSATRGMVSAAARQVEAAVPLRLLQHDAAVNPGSSGGPLVDGAGRVVGMNSRIADGSRHYVGVSYAIAAADLARIVAGLVEETLAPVAPLGLHLRPVTRQVAAALGLAAEGALVDRVEPGGAGARGGLRPGDVIVAAGGAALAVPGDLAFAVEGGQAAGALALEVIRSGARLALTLPLDPPAETALRLREIAGAGPARVAGYALADLGVRLEAREGGAVVVAALTEASPAALAGLAEEDLILAINGVAADLAAAQAFRLTAPALVLVARPGGATRHVLVDPWDASAGFRPQGGANVLDPSVAVF